MRPCCSLLQYQAMSTNQVDLLPDDQKQNDCGQRQGGSARHSRSVKKDRKEIFRGLQGFRASDMARIILADYSLASLATCCVGRKGEASQRQLALGCRGCHRPRPVSNDHLELSGGANFCG
ncbi:hypothetical protein CRV24_003268 [Beauveria bassiana]|nr:hypothetical protein CRV24_003268 [Beauveria bassiana]